MAERSAVVGCVLSDTHGRKDKFRTKFLTVLHVNRLFQRRVELLQFTEPIDGQAFRGHVFKTLTLEARGNCQLSCYRENDCVSYNVGSLTDGKYICELSDSDDREHPEDLAPRHGFIYSSTKANACSKSPCSPHRRCQIGFTDKGYHCECQPGFDGQNCERGSWLKLNADPVCFGARGDNYGSFITAKAGSISALKLVHISGVLICHKDSTRSFWGCEVPGYGTRTLMTLITYTNHTFLLPTGETADMGVTSHICAAKYAYRLDGFDDVSSEIIFNQAQRLCQSQ